MGIRVRILAVAMAIGVAGMGRAAAQTSPSPPAPPTPAPVPPSAAPVEAPPLDAAELARIKRRLAAPTPLSTAAADAPAPTFRVSVSEKIDIWKYWGEPDAVAAYVRPGGGSWHHEFQDMVTPDAFKGYGGILSNGDKLQLAATSLAFAGAMRLLGAGVRQAKEALAERAQRNAKDEVQRELAAFCDAHPEACAGATPTPP
jgi:hypothetical protein